MNWTIDRGVKAVLLLVAAGAFICAALIFNHFTHPLPRILGFIGCLALTFIAAGYLSTLLTRPLREVTAALASYRIGDLKPAPYSRTTAAEIRAVFDAIDEMASSLRTNSEIYRDLFENATDIVFMSDLRGRFVDGNRAVERLLGYTVEEAKGFFLSDLLTDHRPITTEVFKRHARGERYVTYQINARTKSGEIKAFEIASRPMFDCGKLVGYHGTARDVSERKRMQEALIQARRAAEAANQAKSEFLANMSHEIRTPINGIQGFLSLISNTTLSPRQEQYLAPLKESVRHLSRIVNDILDLAKIESGRFFIDRECIDLAALLTATMELFRPPANDKQLELAMQLDPGIPGRMISDGTRIGQIVSNLLNNAIKFTHAGSITLSAALITQTGDHHRIRITVRDTGIGIAAKDRENLFAPFQQADSGRSRRYAGTGLGLTITRNLVRAMGGAIELTSEAGKYTEVTVELNTGTAGAADPSAMDDHARLPVFDGSGLRVLVVDDNRINRLFLLALLEQQFGVRVMQADSGSKAIRLCEQNRFDVVLMDIHMADMDGIETAERIRRLGSVWQTTPIVAVSADVIGDTAGRLRDVGMDGFLGKPVTADDVSVMFNGLFPDRPASTPIKDRDAARGATAILDPDGGIALASGDVELWRNSVDVVVGELPDQLRELTMSVEKRDWAAAQRVAHRLAGSAGYIAAAALERAARAVEKICATPDPGAIHDALRTLRAETGRLRQRAADT